MRFRQGDGILEGGERRVRGRMSNRGGAVRSGEARIA
jgi:hypothetical protein